MSRRHKSKQKTSGRPTGTVEADRAECRRLSYLWQKRALKVLLLIVSARAVAFAQKQSSASYICLGPTVTNLLIGEVPGIPFVAKLVVRPVIEHPDGKVEVVSGPPKEDGIVARNTKGVVVVKLTNLQPYERNELKWIEVVCDPSRQTTTQLWLRPGKTQPDAIATPENPARTQTVDKFRYAHNPGPSQKELGSSIFEGQMISHIQLEYRGNRSRFIEDFMQSDEMFMILGSIRWADDPKSGVMWRMEELRRVEPDKSLMRVPASAATQTLPQPMVPLWMAGPTGPMCQPPACVP